MSESEGTDNPAFSNEEESHENSCTESNREDQSNKSPVDNNTSSQVGNGHSFVSQHYVEPTRNDTDPRYKTETRIEVPGDMEKSQNPTKVNGVHPTGNNDDASFFNNSVASVQTNDGKKEQIEAVNLELVSMRPYATGNNHQKGQEACDLPNDPYEEYFVPVNEHRKYISSPSADIETTVAGVRFDLGPGVGREGLSLRDPAAGLVDYSHWLNALRGEKLYVTKDKRSKSSYWRRIACWGFGLIVLAVALIIAILAATGVILTQEATQPLDPSQQTYEGVKAVGSKEFIENPPSSPPPETSSLTPWPTTDETILKTVPEALNGIIWLDNLTWNDELMDPKSRVYRDVSAEIENSIRDSLFPSSMSVIKVYNITDEGQVMFRISYPPTPTPKMMQVSIEKMLQENGNRVGKWHLSRVDVKSLVDECQYENMGCTEGCKFDYMNSVFMCACPPGKTVDAAGTNCIDDSDLSDVGMDVPQPKLTNIQDAVQGRGGAPDSFFVPRTHDHHDNNHWMHQHDHHPETHANVEPIGEPQSELGEPSSSPESSPKPSSAPEPSDVPASEPEPSAESTPESVPAAEPEPVNEPSSLLPGGEASAEPKSQAEPTSEPVPDSEPETEPELPAEAVTEPSAEPKSEGEPTSEPIPSGIESSAEHKSVTEPPSEPISHSEPSAEPTSEPISDVEPSAEPTSESVSPRTELPAESNSVTQPASTPISYSESSSEPPTESIPDSEPAAEPKTEAEPTSESIIHSESSSEPKSEPNPVSGPAAESKSEAKPTSQPISQSEPSAEPTSQPISDSEPPAEPNSEGEPTAEPNPNAEPSAEPPAVPKPPSEPASEPEPSPETTLEPKAPVEALEVIPLQTDIPKTITATPMKMSTSEKSENPIETISTSTSVPIFSDSHHYSEESIPRSSFEGKVPIEAESEEAPMTTRSPMSADAESFTIIPEIVDPMNISTTSPESPLENNPSITNGFPKLPENISENVAPLNEPVDVTTSTEPTTSIERYEDIHHIHEIIPELTPEHVMHQIPQKNLNALPMNATAIPPHLQEVAELSTIHPLHPIILPHDISEKSTVKTPSVEDKHHEDMSPFLPDVVREKEMPKKAPRLDKDEQDFPNPFEPAVVDDVIIHHENHKNGSEFTDLTNELGQSHVVQQTGTTREEDVSMMHNVTIMPTTVNDTHAVDKITETPLSIDDLEARQMTDTNDTDVSQVNDLAIRMNDEIKLNLTSTESLDVSDVSRVSTSENVTMDRITTEKPREHGNKFEDNAVEDQYNDIGDENVSKDFRGELKRTETVDEKIGNTNAIQQTIKPDININIEMRTSELPIENMTTSKINIETTPVTLEKQNEENNKFTTEIPILPIEIQQDMSTTETADKIGSTVSIVADSDINLAMTTTQASTLETKTTAQVPILPEEFQTTESNDIMSTTEQMTVISNETSNTPSITEEISEQSTTDSIEVKSTTERIVMTASDTPPPTTDEMHNNEDNETTTETVTSPTADFKPVSEAIVDDPEPVTFDRSRFFTTTTEPTIVEEIPEEKLRVIPIDEEDELVKTTIMPEFTEKQMLETEIIPTPEEIPSVAKLKIVEITSSTGDPKTNDAIEESSTESPKMEMDAITTFRTTPEIIPVYEEVEDDSMNPFMMNLSKIITTTEMITEKSEPEVSSQAPVPNLTFSKCNAGQFQCLNGTSRDGAYCVDLSSKCDSENDCSDGSDEINCQEESCRGNFQCTSGQCLKRHLVCNGIVDCDDGSDEQMCTNWTCHFDEFKCPNGRCIPDLWRCDGRPDCDDHKDEYSCSESCGNNEYLCPTEKWCIPQTLRCNGVPDCANGEDEKLCDCTVDQFKCRTGGCINSDQVCDGVEHCPDRSDEWDCLADNSTMEKSQSDDREQLITLKIKMGNERFSVCSDGWSKSHSDEYCKSLGFSGSDITITTYNTGNQVLRLKTPSAGSNLLANLQKSDMCESGEIVKVSCQEFTCGSQESEGPTARLVGGTPAGEGQWSSVALLREVKSGATCTVSVLGPMHALASYSCIYKHRQSLNWELLTGRDLQQSTKVKNILPYPEVKYNQFLYDNDFALIELSQPLVFSRNVSAVCLPSQQFQPRALCVTAGWGFPMNGDVNLKLNFLPIPTYDTKECNATSHYAGFIKENHICAGFTGADKGTCYNDEGAPLMCATETGRWEIQGLLSHHSKCSRGYPAIYSSLAPVISWLHHSIPALQTRV